MGYYKILYFEVNYTIKGLNSKKKTRIINFSFKCISRDRIANSREMFPVSHKHEPLIQFKFKYMFKQEGFRAKHKPIKHEPFVFTISCMIGLCLLAHPILSAILPPKHHIVIICSYTDSLYGSDVCEDGEDVFHILCCLRPTQHGVKKNPNQNGL